MIPTLDTPRLTLRPHRAADYPDACAMWAEPAVTRYIGGRASTPQQTWSRVLAYLGHWALMDFGYWAIEERSSGEFAGEIGFADFKRGIAHEMQDVPELGFALASKFHGRGYASEAVQAVLAWGDEHLDSKRTVALVNEDNAASQRILEKFGYHVFGRSTLADSRVLFLERLPAG